MKVDLHNLKGLVRRFNYMCKYYLCSCTFRQFGIETVGTVCTLLPGGLHSTNYNCLALALHSTHYNCSSKKIIIQIFTKRKI